MPAPDLTSPVAARLQSIDALRGLVNVAGTEVGRPTVNQHRTAWCEHQADVGIQRFVLACAAPQFANMGIDAFGHLLELDFHRTGGGVQERDQQRGKGFWHGMVFKATRDGTRWP